MPLTLYTYMLPFILLFASCQGATKEQIITETNKTAAYTSEIDTAGLSVATFAGGCFWCTEAYFERLKGVEAVISGYAGGEEQNPTYMQVSNGETGHAEGVQVYYKPDQISYEQLLEVFFATHDPTTLNRQGPDVGKQYRSVVFYQDQEEQRLVEKYIAALAGKGTYKGKIVTEVQPLVKFWEAEAYHQDYYIHNPSDPYVQRVAKPKMDKFMKQYSAWLKEWKK